MNIDEIVNKYNLNIDETNIVKYLYENKENLREIGVRKVSADNYVSTTMVIKLAKKLGFSGYSELIFNIINSSENHYNDQNLTEKQIDEFSKLIAKHKDSRIMILASGFSQNIANFMSELLNLYNFRATSNNHLELLTKENDILVIYVSSSGDTQVLVELAEKLNQEKIDSIAFVSSKTSLLNKYATLTIYTENSHSLFKEMYEPNLFFGNCLNQFEILLSESLKYIQKNNI